MAGIVFFFEDNNIDVWSGRNLDLDAWNYSCKIGGIDKAIIVNTTELNINKFDANMDIQIVSELPLLSGVTTQFVVPSENINSESLWDFNHQTDWYILGPANGWAGNHFADRFVHIPQESVAAHHSIFIGSVIAFHRTHVINNI